MTNMLTGRVLSWCAKLTSLAGLMILMAACESPSSPQLSQASMPKGDPSFRINNRSGVVIKEIYATTALNTKWGNDRLGAQVLENGQSFIIRTPESNDCVIDIRIVYQDNQNEDRRNINTCNITDIATNRVAKDFSAQPNFSGNTNNIARIETSQSSVIDDNDDLPTFEALRLGLVSGQIYRENERQQAIQRQMRAVRR